MLVEKACNDKCYPPAKLYPNAFTNTHCPKTWLAFSVVSN